jgi:predicted double-glycine peptidase
MKKTLLCTVVLCLFAAMAGCSVVNKAESGAVRIEGVPFFNQEAYQCGPTALAIVLDYWYAKTGNTKRLAPEQIAADIYSPTAKGVLGFDLENYARKQGFSVRQYSGSLADLRQNVDKEVPSIVFVDYGFSVYEANHFMVVTGYGKDSIIVNSGRHENQAISTKEMEKIWKRNRYWTLVLGPSS